MATEDVPSQGMICCGLCEAWSISVLRLLTKPCTGQRNAELNRPTRQTAWCQLVKIEWHSDTLVLPKGPLCRRFVKLFRVLHTELTAHIHATRFVNMS